MAKYKWIMYIQQNIPGNTSFWLERAASDGQAKRLFGDYSDAVGTDDCSATLYAYDDASWASAEEFRGIGCPFDYPDRIVERGDRGGIKLSRT